MKRCTLLMVVTLFALDLSALAEKTGNDLLASCQAAVRVADNNGGPAAGQFDAGWCIGWVSGALALTQLHNEWTTFTQQKSTLVQFCVLDAGVSAIQAVRILVKYLKEHPEQLHEDGMGLTVAALKGSFPCK